MKLLHRAHYEPVKLTYTVCLWEVVPALTKEPFSTCHLLTLTNCVSYHVQYTHLHAIHLIHHLYT